MGISQLHQRAPHYRNHARKGIVMRLLLLALVLGTAVTLFAGNQSIMVDGKCRWKRCGVSICKECKSVECADKTVDTNVGLDRDKDVDDLTSCPPGYHDFGYQHWPQWWPAADVYLRKCELDQTATATANGNGKRQTAR